MLCIGVCSRSPHINDFAVNFPRNYFCFYLYLSVVHCAASHFRLLFCAFCVMQNDIATPTNQQVEDMYEP